MASPLPLTFVVGTGRCGSTALSRVLRLHPAVLGLSELLTTLEPGALPDHPLDGREFWALLASPRPFADRMIRDGTPLPEHLYPHRPGRFSGGTGVPAVCLTTLPHLTPEPDALFDELRPVLVARPRGPVSGHYRALFAWLADRFGRRVVVERSGFSLALVPRLRRHFPEARFVHLHRDGPDCALSMSRHPGFRLIALAAERAAAGGGDASLDLERLVGDDSVDLGAELARPIPPARFGALWSAMVVDGVAALAALPPGLVASLAYEDLLDAPERHLTRLADHIGAAPDPGWIKAAARLLDGGRRGAAARLPREERDALRASCAPGARALATARATVV